MSAASIESELKSRLRLFVPDTPHQESGVSDLSGRSVSDPLNSVWRKARRGRLAGGPIAFLGFGNVDQRSPVESDSLNTKISGLAARVTGWDEMTAEKNLTFERQERGENASDDQEAEIQCRLHEAACHKVLGMPAVQRMIEAQMRALAGEEELQQEPAGSRTACTTGRVCAEQELTRR